MTLAAGHNSRQLARATEPAFDVQPRTTVEQCWAARALKAESFISARMDHDDDIQTLRSSEESKRSVRTGAANIYVDPLLLQIELAAIRQENDARHTKLETLVVRPTPDLSECR